MTASFLKLFHAQTCGKCVPCRIGLGVLEDMLEDVLDGKATLETLSLIERTAKAIYDSADCAIGYEAGRMVLKGLEGFREDFIEHITNGHCSCHLEQPVPCVALCPAGVDVPGYISLIADERYADAVKLIRKDNPFVTSCALVCEHPCETKCRRNFVDDAVNIRGLKRYAADHCGLVPPPECCEPTGKTVAIIGGGPSGLSAAYYLQQMGHQCTIFEQRKELGGMLYYGIPNYRLPKERLAEDIQNILATGVETKTNTCIGDGDGEISFKMLKETTMQFIFLSVHIQIRSLVFLAKMLRVLFPLFRCCVISEMEIHLILQAKMLSLSAVVTWLWTLPVLLSVLVLKTLVLCTDAERLI